MINTVYSHRMEEEKGEEREREREPARWEY
jgi:hypothetical protein